MSKQSSKSPPPPAQPEESPQPVTFNRRWYWLRAGLVAALVFIFVMWFAYPTRGTTAIVWAGGLAAAMLGYFVVSYYLLNR
jgi:hypothetical protein